ncbi:MAG: type II toxin-antitoxin system VapC family toxin [Caldilineaceae bacterium]|nr:type II toxin-antitoxin system VapC family toxin [Caldilineaceae bacterium]
MILVDSDVLIDLLRGYPPATEWLDSLPETEEIAVPGYVVMELIQGCQNKVEQNRVRRHLGGFGVAWPSPADCDRALDVFVTYRLCHNAGLLDVLIAQTGVTMEVPLYTFNQKHYAFIPGLHTVQPYTK